MLRHRQFLLYVGHHFNHITKAPAFGAGVFGTQTNRRGLCWSLLAARAPRARVPSEHA